MNFLDRFFIEKTGFLSTFFSNPKFEAMVYWSFLEAKSRIFFFYAFSRISPRKINILKKSKMELTELIRLYNINKKQLLLNLNKYFDIYYKKCQKRKKKKSARNFFILKYVIKSFKTSNFYYLKVLA